MSDADAGWSKLQVEMNTLGGTGSVKLDGVDISDAITSLLIHRDDQGKMKCELGMMVELECFVTGDVTILRESGAGRTVVAIGSRIHKIKPADAS